MTDDIMELRLPPRSLSAGVFGFVRRRDDRGGDVVRILPEIRSSIQIFRADPYWVREDEGPWRCVPRAALWGPRLFPAYGFARKTIDVYAVGLTPAGVRALTARPCANFLCAHASPPAPVAAAADAGLYPALSFDSWVALMTDALAAALCSAPPPPPAASAVSALDPADTIADAAQRFGVSERQFRRLFLAEHGATPKAYQRVLRFDAALRTMHPRPWEPAGPDGRSGYADQAHLIREFCEFAGVTPAAYTRAKQRQGDRILRSIVVDDVAPPDC